MQVVSLPSGPPPAGAPANQQPQAASRDGGGFGQVLRALSDQSSEPSLGSAPAAVDLAEAAGPAASAALTEDGGDMAALDLLAPDLAVADTPNPDDQPDPEVTIAAELLSLLVSGAALAAQLPPTAFAITQAAEGAMVLPASVGPEAGNAAASAGPGLMILSSPQISPPDAAGDIPVQTQGFLPSAGDMPDPELPPPFLQAGPGLRTGADAAMPARIIVPDAGPGMPAVLQQAGAVPAVFTFRSEHRSTESGHAAPDADKDGPVAAPPAPVATPGSDVPAPGLAAGATPLAGLPEMMLSAVHPGDPEIQFGAPQSLAQAAPVHLHQAAGAAFVSAPLAATLSDLLMRRTDGPVELTLSPEELGRVRLSLSPDGDGLHVTVQVERGDTLDLLRRNSDLLLQEIRAQGFSGATFSFSGWAGDRPEQRAQPGPETSRPGVPSSPDASPPPASLSPAAGLDLRL